MPYKSTLFRHGCLFDFISTCSRVTILLLQLKQGSSFSKVYKHMTQKHCLEIWFEVMEKYLEVCNTGNLLSVLCWASNNLVVIDYTQFTFKSVIAEVGVSVSLTCPYQLYSSIVTTLVAFTNTCDIKYLYALAQQPKKKKKKVLIIAACCSLLNPTYTTLSFPCEELMSSGLWGARQKLSHCTHRHFCTHALVSLHTLTHTHPWLEFWHSQGLRPVDNEPEPIILSQWIERNRAKNESHRAN